MDEWSKYTLPQGFKQDAYLARCRDGLVIAEGTIPAMNSNGYNLQSAPNTLDEFGRSFPGNPAEAENMNFVKCWNNTESIYVKIVDSCPCTSATANNTAWCCSAVQVPHYSLPRSLYHLINDFCCYLVPVGYSDTCARGMYRY